MSKDAKNAKGSNDEKVTTLPGTEDVKPKRIGELLTGFEMEFLDGLYDLLDKFSDNTGMYIADIKLKHDIKQEKGLPVGVLSNIGIRTGSKGAIIDVIVAHRQAEAAAAAKKEKK